MRNVRYNEPMISPKKFVPTQEEIKLQHYILLLIRVSLVVAMGIMVLRGDWENFFFSGLTLALAFLPELIERKFKINLPIEFELVIVSFNYLSWFAGEALNAYENFWWWDTMLHVSSGLILGFAAFLVIYTGLRRKEIHLTPRMVALLVFLVGIGFGAIWEIFEFAMDQLFGLNMQRLQTGVTDTMKDLIVDGLGAMIMGYVGARYIRREKVWFVSNWIRNFFKYNPQLLFERSNGKK